MLSFAEDLAEDLAEEDELPDELDEDEREDELEDKREAGFSSSSGNGSASTFGFGFLPLVAPLLRATLLPPLPRVDGSMPSNLWYTSDFLR